MPWLRWKEMIQWDTNVNCKDPPGNPTALAACFSCKLGPLHHFFLASLPHHFLTDFETGAVQAWGGQINSEKQTVKKRERADWCLWYCMLKLRLWVSRKSLTTNHNKSKTSLSQPRKHWSRILLPCSKAFPPVCYQRTHATHTSPEATGFTSSNLCHSCKIYRELYLCSQCF